MLGENSLTCSAGRNMRGCCHSGGSNSGGGGDGGGVGSSGKHGGDFAYRLRELIPRRHGKDEIIQVVAHAVADSECFGHGRFGRHALCTIGVLSLVLECNRIQ